MPRFLDELKDKAQSALNATPLGAYVPQGSQSSNPNSGSGGRSHAFDALQHQIRTLQVQYGCDVRQLQLMITGLKGIVLDLDKEAQDAKSFSKEVYIWGQTEDMDVKDVTDRLAYLTFVQGSLTSTLASAIDSSRGPMKTLRDAEVQLQPKRNIRAGYELQISNLRNANKPGTGAKIKELETMLKQAEARDESLEREIDLLKRKAIVESETQKWEAIREYGEKLVLLSQAAKPIIGALPSVPPNLEHPYTGAASTAATRATLQKALDHYQPGNTTLPLPTGAESETRSFGETHAKELSRISSVADHRPPPARPSSPPVPSPERKSSTGSPPPVARKSNSTSPSTPSAPMDPRSLNNAPAPIPVPESPQLVPTAASTEPTELSPDSIPINVPTVAETGVPVVAGKDGPGPASGSLAGGHRGSQSSPSSAAPSGPGYGESTPSYGGHPARYESAEEEKARLQREDRERLLRSGGPPASTEAGASEPSGLPTTYESADDEKQRLEREERERYAAAASQYPGAEAEHDEPEDDGNVPPPYEEPK
ncbi:Eisosome component PIL1-domain-containing protein [Hysterangium stoloniferum]|nr:Eisosome component PIL1-domain-containing protein [Hysterangium stoloniferum]